MPEVGGLRSQASGLSLQVRRLSTPHAIGPSGRLRPGPVSVEVSTVPSVMWNRPGYFLSQPALAIGTYCRELPSIAATCLTCAARPAECTNEAPGHVRSWTHMN